MGLDISIWTAVAWLMFICFALNTKNYFSMFVFKITPFIISVALAVFWAMERGFIINTGG
jgi:hypothetical protein